MRAKEFVQEVNIDNENGIGSTPYNRNVDYLGLRVLMKPSVFLKLATPLVTDINPKVQQWIQDGGAIAAPFLEIELPDQWRQGDFSEPAQVVGHEGRNRMTVVRKIEGDAPVEVHLFFPGGYRARHLTPEYLKALQQGLYMERTKAVLHGPIWETSELDEDWKKPLAGAVAAATMGYGALANVHQPSINPQPAAQVQPAAGPVRDIDQELEDSVPAAHRELVRQARAAGIHGDELIHFLAQVKRETGNFRSLAELAPKKSKNPQAYFMRKYDFKKHTGNIYKGDGWRFRGSGYMMMSHRYNFTKCSKALYGDLRLVENPDLVRTDQDTAIKTAIWYWKTFVSKKIKNFSRASVHDVTGKINPGKKHDPQRLAYYNQLVQR